MKQINKEPTDEEIIDEAIENDDIDTLVQSYFGYELTPWQLIIVTEIFTEKYNRFSISAMTRYGKTWCVAIAMALCILFGENQKIYFVSPTNEQSLILRDYLAELIRICPELLKITDLTRPAEKKLTTQTSKAHQTFSNGCSYRVFTAHDDAATLMGHGLGIGGGKLIIDEACQIKNKAYAKIIRMLGDNPEKTMLIELYNPWSKDTMAYDNFKDNKFRKIHIDWKIALEEGRTTKEHIDEMRSKMTSLEFTVLYDSNFPGQAEDALFNMDNVDKCIIDKDTPDFDSPWLVISADVADKGLDKTVIMIGKQHKDYKNYIVNHIFWEDKSENVNIAGEINNLILKNKSLYNKISVYIDVIGLGVGVVSMVKEFVRERHLGVSVIGCHYGEKSKDPERFANKKAEKFFKLSKLFDEGKIHIPDNKDLYRELNSMTWKLNSSSKITIIDPDKSPDYADSLVYFTWGEDEYQGGGYFSA